MLRSRQRNLAALAVALATGCIDQSPIEPHNSTIVVHAVLDVDARDQYVIVQQVDSVSGIQQQVVGAVVTITAPDGRVLSASEVTDSIEFQSDYRQSRVTRVYRMTPSDLGVSFAAGQVYSLRVVTPSGRVVSGSTTIPVSPLPVGDASRVDTVHVERDSILVNWILSPTARAYELAISFHDGNYPSALTIYRAFADSGFVMSARSRFLSSLILRNGIVNDIAVVAVDANYYDYYRRGSDLFGGTGIINHLNGGVGVFAAIGRVNHQRVFAIFPPAP